MALRYMSSHTTNLLDTKRYRIDTSICRARSSRAIRIIRREPKRGRIGRISLFESLFGFLIDIDTIEVSHPHLGEKGSFYTSLMEERKNRLEKKVISERAFLANHYLSSLRTISVAKRKQ